MFFSFKRGFSLIEMLVVLGIFTVITSVVIADLPSFRDKTILELVAQEIAVTIRQAQSYGVGTRSFAGKFPSHGIYFGGANSLILYADFVPTENNYYDVGSGCGSGNTECIETYNLPGGVNILARLNCSSGCDLATPLSAFNVLFVRPKLDAVFTNNTGGTLGGGAGYTHIGIVLNSLRDKQQRCQIVRVVSTGQILAEPFSGTVNGYTCS